MLSTLQQLDPVPGEVSVVVICNARELAYQIRNEYLRFSKYMPDVKTAVFYGGTPIQKDAELLKNKETAPHIVVATPGRLKALVRDKLINLGHVKNFVIDECDKVLEASFGHEKRCSRHLQSYSKRQTSYDVFRYFVSRN